MEELQLADGVARPDNSVDVVMAAPGSPDSLSDIGRLHDARNVARRSAIALGIAAVVAVTLVAQKPLNFAGNWVLDRDRTAALVAARTGAAADGAASRGSVSADGGFTGVMTAQVAGSQEQTITQSAIAITIERVLATDRQKVVYKLDGTESININGRSTLTTSSHWDEDKLVTEGTQVTMTDRGTIHNTFKEVRTIDNDGAMVVETTRQFDGGAQLTTLQLLVRRK